MRFADNVTSGVSGINAAASWDKKVEENIYPNACNSNIHTKFVGHL